MIGRNTVTDAEAAAPPALGVAVTVQAVAKSGATYRPELETDPQDALQVAFAFAVNCFESPSVRFALVGEMAMFAFPTPERATFWGLLPAESPKLSVAGACAGRAGDRRRSLPCRAPDAGRLDPQVVLPTAKSVGLAPPMAMLPIVIDVVESVGQSDRLGWAVRAHRGAWEHKTGCAGRNPASSRAS